MGRALDERAAKYQPSRSLEVHEMTKCSKCGVEAQGRERFCGQCGHTLTATDLETPKPTAHPAVSRIELDPGLVNTLLAMYASKPGGPQFRLEDGRLQVGLGEHALDLNPVQLDQVAQVMLKTTPLGSLSLTVDHISLDANGLEVRLRHRS